MFVNAALHHFAPGINRIVISRAKGMSVLAAVHEIATRTLLLIVPMITSYF